MSACLNVCMYVCTCVCMFECMYVCMYVCSQVPVSACLYASTYASICMYVGMHIICMYTENKLSKNIFNHTYIHTYILAKGNRCRELCSIAILDIAMHNQLAVYGFFSPGVCGGVLLSLRLSLEF